MTTMHVNSSSGHLPPPDPLDPCCMGAAVYGDRCTCWEPELDIEPNPLTQHGPNPARRKCCHDCAFRAGSPEREAAGGDPMPYNPDRPFFCHQDMPRIVRWRHPSGAVIDATQDDYQPIQTGHTAWLIDGRPADICGGWAAINRGRGPHNRQETQ